MHARRGLGVTAAVTATAASSPSLYVAATTLLAAAYAPRGVRYMSAAAGTFGTADVRQALQLLQKGYVGRDSARGGA
jgi:hypothetical protein